MLEKLNTGQKLWVDKTLESMDLGECIGQLLMPHHPFESLQTDFPSVSNASTDDWIRLLDRVPLGGICIRKPPSDDLKEMLEDIQSQSKIPVIVGSNIEPGSSGPARIQGKGDNDSAVLDYSSHAPSMMGFAAADDPDLTFTACRMIAEQRRAHGFHWTFTPVVDINLNYRNPITNVRSLGDDTDKVIKHAESFVRGFQEDGLMAATAKHFPGDGTDERDHHLLTTSNHLSVNDWQNSYGRVWKSVIEVGVNSVMVGHIAFPAYERFVGNSEHTLPATLSKRVQLNLLREELGFEGVIISDASPMAGLTSRVSYADRAVENILAGVDVILLPETIQDYGFIEDAVRKGKLTEERVRNSTRRILELKARLSLHKGTFIEEDVSHTAANAEEVNNAIAEKSITVLRRSENGLGGLKRGEKILFVNVFSNGIFTNSNLDTLIAALEAEGISIDSLDNPTDTDLREKLPHFDAVFVNICHVPMSGSFDQIGAGFAQSVWRIAHMYHDRVNYTCFGTPYVLHDLPHVPNMLLAYGASASVQLAIAKVWTGKLEPRGILPVEEPQVAY